MKTRFIAIAAFAAALCASCQGDYSLEPETPQKVTLNVSLGGPLTKAMIGGSTQDMTFNNAQIFVYNKQGKLEAKSGRVTTRDGISLSIVPGTKTIWALVNAPVLSLEVGTSETPGTKQSLLSDNTLNSLVMSGSKSVSVTGATDVSVEVKHIAAKIVLDKITRSFTDVNLSEVPMTITKIYMSNVAADCDYACSGAAPTVWNCKMGVFDNPIQNSPLILDSGLNVSLAEGATYNNVHTFYVYPNPTTEDNTNDTWSPRKTRLVLECEYNGKPAYYPVTINTDTIERNKVYHITGLTLKRPGSQNAEKKDPMVSSNVNCTFGVSVSNWENEDPYAEEF